MCTVPEDVPAAVAPPDEPIEDVPAWESIELTRRPERPGVEELLRAASHSVTILSGTQEGERSGGLILAMAKFGAAPCVVVGQDRLFPREGRPLGPDSLREARRGMSLAAEIGLPCSRSSIRLGPPCPKRLRKAGSPARSPDAWPTW